MSPVLVHLARRALARRDYLIFCIERQAPGCAWAFRLSPDELAFARALLRVRTNLWLFRTHQQRSCADFVVVDMSEAMPRRRVAQVVEVKLGRAIRPGRGTQFIGTPAALAELTELGVLDEESPHERVLGGREALLAMWSA